MSKAIEVLQREIKIKQSQVEDLSNLITDTEARLKDYNSQKIQLLKQVGELNSAISDLKPRKKVKSK